LRATPSLKRFDAPPQRLHLFKQRQTAGRKLRRVRRLTSFVCSLAEVKKLSRSSECSRDADDDADRRVAALIRLNFEERRMIDPGTSRELVLRPAQGAPARGDSLPKRHARGL
jgi:hypothetical protein